MESLEIKSSASISSYKLVGFTFTTLECKQAYTNFVKGFAGTYSFPLNIDPECPFYGSIKSKTFGQISMPCKCFGYDQAGGSVNFDKVGTAYGGIGFTCSPNVVIGTAPGGAYADPVIISPVAVSSSCTLNGKPVGGNSINPKMLGAGGSFTGSWEGGCRPPRFPSEQRKFTPCAGCGFPTSIDLSEISYSYSGRGLSYTVAGKYA
jgi:hypothetical protein